MMAQSSADKALSSKSDEPVDKPLPILRWLRMETELPTRTLPCMLNVLPIRLPADDAADPARVLDLTESELPNETELQVLREEPVLLLKRTEAEDPPCKNDLCDRQLPMVAVDETEQIAFKLTRIAIETDLPSFKLSRTDSVLLR